MNVLTYAQETEKIITGSLARYEEKLDQLLEPVYLEEKKYFKQFVTMSTHVFMIDKIMND